MKATWVKIGGVGKDIYKTPKTDNGMKKSAKGRLAVAREAYAGDLVLIEQATPRQECDSLLRPVWRDGELLVDETFDVVRNRARENL